MFTSTLLASLLALASTVAGTPSRSKAITYSVVPDVFLQDLNSTNPSGFDYIATNFGLINRTYPSDPSCPSGESSTQWQRLSHYVSTLNKKSPKNEQYVLMLMGRHGEGYHNAAESYFGTPGWNCYWSELDGNGTHTWADAKLTSEGVYQAQRANNFWAHLIKNEKITTPEKYYTSPLYRCLDTAKITFTNLTLPKHKPFKPVIKEFLREGISAHTCDRRSTRSYIHANFPTFVFEKGFPEHDPYWQVLRAEPRSNQDARSKIVLDDIVSGGEQVVAISSHSGEISSLLRVLNHRPFSLTTGSSIPVLVKAVTADGPPNPSPTAPYTPQKTCKVAPTIRESSCNDCSCCE